MQQSILVTIIKGGESLSLTEFSFDNRFVIGRDLSCQVVLSSPLVSRAHAEVKPEGGFWVLYDNRSTNGVFVNGERVPRFVLENGQAEVEFGKGGPCVLFKVEAIAEPQKPAAFDMNMATNVMPALTSTPVEPEPEIADQIAFDSAIWRSLGDIDAPTPAPEEPIAIVPPPIPQSVTGKISGTVDTNLLDALDKLQENTLPPIPAVQVAPPPIPVAEVAPPPIPVVEATPPPIPVMEAAPPPIPMVEVAPPPIPVVDVVPPPIPVVDEPKLDDLFSSFEEDYDDESESAPTPVQNEAEAAAPSPSFSLDSGFFSSLNQITSEESVETAPVSPDVPNISPDVSAPADMGLNSGFFRALDDIQEESAALQAANDANLAEEAEPKQEEPKQEEPASTSSFSGWDVDFSTLMPPDPPIETAPPVEVDPPTNDEVIQAPVVDESANAVTPVDMGLNSGFFRALDDIQEEVAEKSASSTAVPALEIESKATETPAPAPSLDSGFFRALDQIQEEVDEKNLDSPSSIDIPQIPSFPEVPTIPEIPVVAEVPAIPEMPVVPEPPAVAESSMVPDMLGTSFFTALTEEAAPVAPVEPETPEMGLNTSFFAALHEDVAPATPEKPPASASSSSEMGLTSGFFRSINDLKDEAPLPVTPNEPPKPNPKQEGLSTGIFEALKNVRQESEKKTKEPEGPNPKAMGLNTEFFRALDDIAENAPSSAISPQPWQNEPEQQVTPKALNQDDSWYKPEVDWDSGKQDWGNLPPQSFENTPAQAPTSEPAPPFQDSAPDWKNAPSAWPDSNVGWKAPPPSNEPDPFAVSDPFALPPSEPKAPAPAWTANPNDSWISPPNSGGGWQDSNVGWNAPSTPNTPNTPQPPSTNAPANTWDSNVGWNAPPKSSAAANPPSYTPPPANPTDSNPFGVNKPPEGWDAAKPWEPSMMAPAYKPADTSGQPAGTVSGYVKKFNEGDNQGMGSRTMMMMQAFKQMDHKKRRNMYIAIAVTALIAMAAGIWAYVKHEETIVQAGVIQGQSNVISSQDQELAKMFYQIKELQLNFANDSTLQKNTKLRNETVKTIQNMQQSFTQSMHNRPQYKAAGASLPRGADGRNVDQIIMDITRTFGENEISMPSGYVETVKKYINYWKGSRRWVDAVRRAQSNGYIDFVVQNFMRKGVPPQFFYLGLQESNYQADIVGPSTRYGYAKGAFQFIPGTAQQYGLFPGQLASQPVADPTDQRQQPQLASRAAADYLSYIYKTKAGASGLLVMASYNWGEGNVIKKVNALGSGVIQVADNGDQMALTAEQQLNGLDKSPRKRNFWAVYTTQWMPEETKNYVFYIVSAAVIGENPRLFGINMDNPLYDAIHGNFGTFSGGGTTLGGGVTNTTTALAPLTMTVEGEQKDLFKYRTFW